VFFALQNESGWKKQQTITIAIFCMIVYLRPLSFMFGGRFICCFSLNFNYLGGIFYDK